MRIDVLTIFPKFFENAFDFSIVKKAKEKKLVTIEIHDIRKYSTLNYHTSPYFHLKN